MSLRFALAVGLLALAIAGWIYNAARITQIQTLDSDIDFATNGILAQFHALGGIAQSTADKITAAPTAAMRDDDDPGADKSSSSAESDGSPISFVQQIGSSDEFVIFPHDDLYVRLVDKTGKEVAACKPLTAHPEIDAALATLHPERRGDTTYDFAGGGALPVMRVETVTLRDYRMQVSRNWKKSGDWLLWFASILAAIVAALAGLAGAGGFAVARSEVKAQRQLDELLARQTPLVSTANAEDAEVAPVVAERKLREATAAQDVQAGPVEEKPPMIRRVKIDEVEERQKLGRGE
jgi:hypothetical protein